MSSYIVRPKFTIVKNDVIYTGGDSVELNDEEFEWHKHKLEGIESDVKPVVDKGNNNTDPGTTTRRDRPIIRRVNLINSIELTTDEAIRLHVICERSGIEIYLPKIKEKGDGFVIKNSIDSPHKFVCSGINIFPGDFYEVWFDGVEWLEY